jgi:hypothetical protein
MQTALERAAAQEARRLRIAGLNPDGTPIKPVDPVDPVDPADPVDPVDPVDLVDPMAPVDPPNDSPNDPPGDVASLRAALAAAQQELESAKRDLLAMQGRVSPSQRDAEMARTMWLESERQKQQLQEELDQLKAAAATRAEPIKLDVSTVLSQQELADIDPVVLGAIEKVAAAMVANASPAPQIDVEAEVVKIQNKKDLEKVKNHRIVVLTDKNRNVSKLNALMSDPKFTAWYETEGDILESVMSSLIGATTTEAVDRYAKAADREIARYLDLEKPKSPPLDPSTRSLSTHARREAPAKLSEAEIADKAAEAKRLSRSRSPADQKRAGELLAELDKLT